jgi:hypothetical protein
VCSEGLQAVAERHQAGARQAHISPPACDGERAPFECLFLQGRELVPELFGIVVQLARCVLGLLGRQRALAQPLVGGGTERAAREQPERERPALPLAAPRTSHVTSLMETRLMPPTASSS